MSIEAEAERWLDAAISVAGVDPPAGAREALRTAAQAAAEGPLGDIEPRRALRYIMRARAPLGGSWSPRHLLVCASRGWCERELRRSPGAAATVAEKQAEKMERRARLRLAAQGNFKPTPEELAAAAATFA